MISVVTKSWFTRSEKNVLRRNFVCFFDALRKFFTFNAYHKERKKRIA